MNLWATSAQEINTHFTGVGQTTSRSIIREQTNSASNEINNDG